MLRSLGLLDFEEMVPPFQRALRGSIATLKSLGVSISDIAEWGSSGRQLLPGWAPLLEARELRAPWSATSSYSRLQNGKLPRPRDLARLQKLADWLACIEVDARIGRALVQWGGGSAEPTLTHWAVDAAQAIARSHDLPPLPAEPLTPPGLRSAEEALRGGLIAELVEARSAWVERRAGLFGETEEPDSPPKAQPDLTKETEETPGPSKRYPEPRERTEEPLGPPESQSDLPTKAEAPPGPAESASTGAGLGRRRWPVRVLAAAAILGLTVIVWAAGWRRPPVIVGAIQARFEAGAPYCYFVWVTNTWSEPIEVTHVWYETRDQKQIAIRLKSRPMPRRLQPRESWAVWISAARIPAKVAEAYERFRVRLSEGQVLKSRHIVLPKEGDVFGGPMLPSEEHCESPR